jgi:hypothetical protein
MPWSRGEVWFDADVLWFGERARTPALAGFGSLPLPTFGPPPGLAASRQRREAWKRKRRSRQVRTAALVLAPAVILPIAAIRGTGYGSGSTAEDPPSLTIPPRVTGAFSVPLSYSLGEVPRVMSATETADPQDISARTEDFPSVVWHHATSVGLPFNGYLVDGTQLPIEGENWVTWNPNTNSVPNDPLRLYGNDHTIRTVIAVIDAYREANPDAPRVVVGDISRKGGGPFTDQHVSHQNGLDVDIYYPRTDGELREPTSPDQIDHQLAQDLLDRFVAAGAQMIFVGYATGLTGPSGVVIPYPNHDNHMHVRFPPPG